MRPVRPKEEEILLWCGVIAQLARTRANKLLAQSGLPYPLFVLLRHFCHDPAREWTIGQLTNAFETGQSGMTKQVRKLLDMGYLSARSDAEDARVKWLKVTTQGEQMRDSLMARLAPDQQSYFNDWAPDDVESLHRHLFRLKSYLDDNRSDVIYPSTAREA